MKLMTDRCCAANDSMFLLPSLSVSPNAYCAPSVENKMRASANVIHPRSSAGNVDKESASVASVVPSSFMASDGAAASAPNSHPMKLIIPIVAFSYERPELAPIAERHRRAVGLPAFNPPRRASDQQSLRARVHPKRRCRIRYSLRFRFHRGMSRRLVTTATVELRRTHPSGLRAS